MDFCQSHPGLGKWASVYQRSVWDRTTVDVLPTWLGAWLGATQIAAPFVAGIFFSPVSVGALWIEAVVPNKTCPLMFQSILGELPWVGNTSNLIKYILYNHIMFILQGSFHTCFFASTETQHLRLGWVGLEHRYQLQWHCASQFHRGKRCNLAKMTGLGYGLNMVQRVLICFGLGT